MSEQPATWEALFDELEKIEPKPINLSTTPGVVAWGKFYHVINGFIALVSKPHKKEDLDKGWFFIRECFPFDMQRKINLEVSAILEKAYNNPGKYKEKKN